MPSDQGVIDWRLAGSGAAGTLIGVGLTAALAAASMGVEADPARHVPLVYLDILPHPPLAAASRQAAQRPGRATERERTTAAAATPPSPPVLAPSSVQPDLAPANDLVLLEAAARRSAVARSLRRGASDCPALLDEIERAACLDRLARRMVGGPGIAGTGDAARDAAFNRQGARRLAAWEAQRASSARGDPPCETPHPVAGCEGVNIQVDLFSSRDGFLPNLRKRRE